MNRLNYRMDKNRLKNFFQFVKFGFVGLSNTIISLIIYYLCIFWGLNYILANTLSFIAGVINSYYWNSKYVFNEQRRSNKKINSVVKVFISYGVTFIISTLLLVVWIDIFSISNKIAPLINLLITIPLNFILNKYWAFK